MIKLLWETNFLLMHMNLFHFSPNGKNVLVCEVCSKVARHSFMVLFSSNSCRWYSFLSLVASTKSLIWETASSLYRSSYVSMTPTTTQPTTHPPTHPQHASAKECHCVVQCLKLSHGNKFLHYNNIVVLRQTA